MFGSDIVDVALGLTFVYLVFSLVLTSIQELIEARLKTRAATLEEGIRQILADPTGTALAGAFFAHPLINALSPGTYIGATTKPANLPSYIPAQSFSAAILALQNAGKIAAGTPVANLLGDLKTLAGDDLAKTRGELEDWYNGAMDRVSGVYKRKTQWRVLVVATFVTFGMNINSLTIVRSLVQDKALRTVVVAQAEAAAKTAPDKPKTAEAIKSRFDEIQQIGVPIGWDKPRRDAMLAAISYDPEKSSPFGAWLSGFELLLGWLMTIGAISLGAPFWFDALNKIMVLRATVKPDEKSPPDKSKG